VDRRSVHRRGVRGGGGTSESTAGTRRDGLQRMAVLRRRARADSLFAPHADQPVECPSTRGGLDLRPRWTKETLVKLGPSRGWHNARSQPLGSLSPLTTTRIRLLPAAEYSPNRREYQGPRSRRRAPLRRPSKRSPTMECRSDAGSITCAKNLCSGVVFGRGRTVGLASRRQAETRTAAACAAGEACGWCHP
jgi:hypothetical protein